MGTTGGPEASGEATRSSVGGEGGAQCPALAPEVGALGGGGAQWLAQLSAFGERGTDRPPAGSACYISVSRGGRQEETQVFRSRKGAGPLWDSSSPSGPRGCLLRALVFPTARALSGVPPLVLPASVLAEWPPPSPWGSAQVLGRSAFSL